MSFTLGPEQIARLKKLIDEGCVVTQEVQDLKDGLKDTVRSIAEELDIKPALLNKVIRMAYKTDTLEKSKDDLDDVEALLDITGRK